MFRCRLFPLLSATRAQRRDVLQIQFATCVCKNRPVDPNIIIVCVYIYNYIYIYIYPKWFLNVKSSWLPQHKTVNSQLIKEFWVDHITDIHRLSLHCHCAPFKVQHPLGVDLQRFAVQTRIDGWDMLRQAATRLPKKLGPGQWVSYVWLWDALEKTYWLQRIWQTDKQADALMSLCCFLCTCPPLSWAACIIQAKDLLTPLTRPEKILKDRITPGTAKAGKIKEMMENRFCERAVCDRGVCERVVSVWKTCVWQSCVWQNGAWKSCVWQSCVCERVVCECERLVCVSVKDLCVCDRVVCDKMVCERVVCDKVVCERVVCVCKRLVCVCGRVVCMWQSCVCVWKTCVTELCVTELCVCVCVSKLCVCERVVCDQVVCLKELCVCDNDVCVWKSCVWKSCVCVCVTMLCAC